ncbi:50S ribosomal protein L3 N(5)-glutamine methyltransferase [Simiduia agarivorans]|uniref:Ribosomal protein uL3 glutamine methyltransferase n=1 Tax=Simiduia agarivorans (strain DSM 21679 / JCM 13881 / BCRC 17597 / SA1) TaxID=1117647 RepID=K4KHV8_SIMAS|nr:50S ribosomal protein L3 N(5)-glutamine methyltransferase [Simiduia agarivorans]AFU97558.1 HemK family modification methylase [Simiduia agarivorans SA1 = DSM 21679]
MNELTSPPIDDLVSVQDWVRWGASQLHAAGVFFGHGTDNAWDESLQLVLHAIHMRWSEDPRLLSCRLSRFEREAVAALVARRINERIPVAYLTGEAMFAGLPFSVDERVLVPRSPIGELIEREFQPWLTQSPARILDLCTGSGCIGIACALAFPNAQVVLSDISSDALAVAESNIDRYQLDGQVYTVQSDGFAGLKGQVFDLIVSNPPYVDAQDLASMPPEYLCEPSIGLGSGHDGLDFTRQILAQAANHLTDQGVLIVEVGNSWEALEQAFPHLPFTWLEFERGGHGVFMLAAGDLRASQ